MTTAHSERTAAPSAEDAAASGITDSAWIETALGEALSPGALALRAARTRLMLLLGLAGAAVLVLWWHMLATSPALNLQLQQVQDGQLTLQRSADPALQPAWGQVLRAVRADGGPPLLVDATTLSRSARWQVSDAARQIQLSNRERLAQLLQQPQVTLLFDDGQALRVAPQPRGMAGLGPGVWLLGALALALFGAGVVVLLGQPSRSSLLFAVMALAEATNLLLISAETLPGWGQPTGFAAWDLGGRLLADAVLCVALVQVMMVYPRPLAGLRRWALPLWLLVPALAALHLLTPVPGLWWWAQGGMLAAGGVALALLLNSRRQEANPLSAMLLRLTAAAVGTLLLLTLAIALADSAGLAQHLVATIGSIVWHIFVAALLMLSPFLSRTRKAARELAMLAGVCTVACSLDLLFITVLGFGQAAAITLALAVALLLYVGARHWALTQLAGASGLSAERMFENLYRAARELEQSPDRAGEQLTALLREAFDPLELTRSQRAAQRSRLAADGSALMVPVPQLGPSDATAGTIVLRFAHRGRRLFTSEDLRLTERIIEQLRRAVAYDRAVEHGRREERARIAQDLHDDIGARLLTLMYKAQNPEIEEYIRHTLQDLKTLTRGLAAGNHRLSHAAAEWKADMAQRLAATGCDLRWSFSCDRDSQLTVVQWSGITRVLRELVNNIITHAQATQVEVLLQVERQRLQLVVSDDGCGRAPQGWSHGLGLGGVRKRVKLLGGDVVWRERQPRGIRCEVQASLISERTEPT
jgi:signal transduction histidine kinase